MSTAVCFAVAAVGLPPAIACAVMSYCFAARRSDGSFGALTAVMALALTAVSVSGLARALIESAPPDTAPAAAPAPAHAEAAR